MAPTGPGANGREGRGFLASVTRFWTRSYAPDYLGFALLLTGWLLITFFMEPFHRMFAINDLNISFPHAEVERVSVPMNFVYALFVPLGAILLVNALSSAPAHKHHVSILGLAIAIILTMVLTDLVKNMVGRPRPDLLARCQPTRGTPKDTLVSLAVCTETDHHRLHDGWRSFPSGHSSFSFAGLGYTALFLSGQLRIFVRAARGGPAAADIPGSGNVERIVHVRGDLGRALLCLVPLVGATLVAISRCQDYRHDVWDVSAGAALGWVVGYWSYRRYWPRLGSGRCDEPYPGPGTAAGGGVKYGRLRDEEEGTHGQNVGYEMTELNPRVA